MADEARYNLRLTAAEVQALADHLAATAWQPGGPAGANLRSVDRKLVSLANRILADMAAGTVPCTCQVADELPHSVNLHRRLAAAAPLTGRPEG